MVPGHREFFSLLPLYLPCEQDKHPAFCFFIKTSLYILTEDGKCCSQFSAQFHVFPKSK